MRRAYAILIAFMAGAPAAADPVYYRHGAQTVASTPQQATPVPIPTSNGVPGTGSLSVSGPTGFRTPSAGAFTYQVQATGASGAVTWSSVGNPLPPGTSLTQDGTVAGSPTARGTYPGIVAQATDAAGRTGTTKPFVIAVGQPVVTNAPSAASLVARTGAPFTIQGTATALLGAPSWSLDIVSGSLPGGLDLKPGGSLSGTPLQDGIATISLRVKDALDGAEGASGPVSLTFKAPLALSGLQDTVGLVSGTSFTGTMNAENVIGTADWSFPDPFPDGIKVTGTGNARTISGVPTGALARTVRIIVTDSADAKQIVRTIDFKPASPIGIQNRTYLNLAVAPGATQSISLRLSGVPNGPVTWSFPYAVPSWIKLTGCDASGCTMTASPPANTPQGKLPASGAYTVWAADASGTADGLFTVLVGTRPAILPPNRVSTQVSPYTVTFGGGGSPAAYSDGSDASGATLGNYGQSAFLDLYWPENYEMECAYVRYNNRGAAGQRLSFDILNKEASYIYTTLQLPLVSGIGEAFVTIPNKPSMGLIEVNPENSGNIDIYELRAGYAYNGTCR